jgi:aspartate kinase
MREVFKFGGASVKDALSVRNIPKILSEYSGKQLVIIVSAMGKTTNALEALHDAAFCGKMETGRLYEQIMRFHLDVANALFTDPKDDIFKQIGLIFESLLPWLKPDEKTDDDHAYDLYYDQIVPAGELLSTLIISHYLNHIGHPNSWLDAREMVITDDTYRSALVDWELSGKKIKQMVLPELEQGRMVITQGFIGGHGKHSTTLGREGSDFSAAIFAHVLDADAVVVWKDVPGYLNADPRYFENTVKLDKLSFNESVELAFYGAKIIHPKTIRPLKTKNIPLWVKSFLDPTAPGSLIHNDLSSDALVPSCIIKEDQVLISISTRDFSFIAEDHLHRIFGLMAAGRTAINLMQNSAISFSVCVDNNPRLPALLSELQHEFRLRYNHGLQLITIRHYDQPTIEKLTKGKEILLEQRSRLTVQMVVKQT